MIVTCPSCQTRFVVNPAAIGIKGRRVRCVQCKHEWFHEPVDEALIRQDEQSAEEVIKPAEKTASASGQQPQPEQPDMQGVAAVPPVIRAKKVPLGLKMAACVLILAFFFVLSIVKNESLLTHLPFMKYYYALLGIYDSHGVVLSDIYTQVLQDDGQKNLFISGQLLNRSDTIKHLPGVRVILKDTNKATVKTVILTVDNTMIQPGEKVDFENTIRYVPQAAQLVVIDIGNRLGLALR